MRLNEQQRRFGLRAVAWGLGFTGTVADVISQTALRPWLSDFYENSAGNFAITFCTTIALGALAELKDKSRQ